MLQKVAISFVVMTFGVFNLITPNIKNNLSCYFPKKVVNMWYIQGNCSTVCFGFKFKFKAITLILWKGSSRN